MSYGLQCPSCDGLRTAVLEALPDPEHPEDPRKYRIRECVDCGARLATVERVVPIEELRARRAVIQADRRALSRLFDAALHRRATVGHENGRPVSRLPATASGR